MRTAVHCKLILFLGVVLATFALGAASVSAASPWWRLNTSLRPSTLKPGGEGTVVVQAVNVGDGCTSRPGADGVSCTEDDEGIPATVSVTLPEHASIVGTKFFDFPFESGSFDLASALPAACETTSSTVTCSTAKLEKEAGIGVHGLNPFEFIEIRVQVKDQGVAPGAAFTAAAGGGGAPAVSESHALTVGSAGPVFGAEELSLVPEEPGGGIDARAASHPFQLTNTFNLNQNAGEFEEKNGQIIEQYLRPPALARNLNFRLPPGQLGNPLAYPRCSLAQFGTVTPAATNRCPDASAIGVAMITVDEPVTYRLRTFPVPLFNLEPAHGEPARFGFLVTSSPVILDTSLRSGAGEDYGVTVSALNTTQTVNFIASTVVFWGAPGDQRHNGSRGWGCIAGGYYDRVLGGTAPCNPTTQPHPPAFLTSPTNCAAPYSTSVEGVSWPNQSFPSGAPLAPLSYSLEDSSKNPGGLVGCNQVPFAPTVTAQPSTENASSASGLDVNVDFHDEGLVSSEGLAQSDLKNIVVTLPEGLTINPSAGVGLGGCRPADYARETFTSEPGAGCPNDSKLGTVEIETPLLTQKIHGSLFIAQPHENPFNSLVALYIVARSPETGVLIKLAGRVTPNPVTGQLTTIFEDNPQLPFSHFNFHFREGQQAPLITPASCGTFQTKAELMPWSEPSAVLTDSSAFQITRGFDGGACPSGGAPPFHPAIQSGTLNNNAGTYSPFYLHLTRTDGEQEISGFSTDLPPGLTGSLTGIPFCPEAAIATARTKTGREEETTPSCPAASQVGHTQVGTGVGSVLAYTPGRIYLAGPYDGDPFSLVSVTSAVVGPFDLGTVVVRFGLRIDPRTAQISVDPTASEPIPHIIDGIVTHVRDIRVYIDRANFTLNPTSCNPLAIGSTLTASEGASATVTSPFQAASCANLKFAPKFSVSTAGKTSRANGASLSVKLTYPQAPQGTQANITRVKVDLPKQLPSRLTTLQKACTAAQFDTNPAGCPSASIIGHAKAITPLIPVPLEGPAIFVSHGGEAFPSLVIVLQGYGVTIDLVGSTFISKAGITSTTFKAVPDNPVSSFELTLPEGKYSALAANGNLCALTHAVTVKKTVRVKVHGKTRKVARRTTKLLADSLVMPTEFVAQNGAKINETTKISVAGCAKHKVKRAKRRGRHPAGRRRPGGR